MMDPFLILQYSIQYGPLIKAAIDESMSNDDLITKIRKIAGPFAPLLEQIGGTWFPQAKPALHIAAAAMAAFDPSVTKWLQGGLNVLLSPSPNLRVDGVYGAATRNAVIAYQTQMGLSVDGWAGRLTQAAIDAALAKYAPAAIPPPPVTSEGR